MVSAGLPKFNVMPAKAGTHASFSGRYDGSAHMSLQRVP